MQKYIVTAYSVGGLKNKVFYEGDIVYAAQFGVPIEELVADKFVAVYEEPEEEVVTDPPADPVTTTSSDETTDETGGEDEESGDGEVTTEEDGSKDEKPEVVIPKYDSITRAEILKKLGELTVEHNPSETKKNLYPLLVKALES